MSTEFITTPGYYGKVPTHGDFVSSGLPRSFIDPWDTWLQEAIMTSRKQLGHQWLNYYLTSPLYRFVLSPGICGESGWMGILMPSVDRIGRYYPMTIGLMNNEGINPFVALQKTDWFAKMEKLALSCLTDNFNLDEFNKGISLLAPEIVTGIADTQAIAKRMNDREFYPAWRQPLNSIEAIADLFPSMLDNMLNERCFAYSLWWTQGSELISPSLLFSAGLPPFEGVAAMFDGNWRQWGWEGNRYPVPPLEQRDNDCGNG